MSTLETAFDDFSRDNSLINLMTLRNLVAKYHPVAVKDSETWDAITSPYFGVDDFRWFLKQLGSMEEYFALNKQLFDYTFDFDVYARSTESLVPVYFISGSDDWICPVDSVQEYLERVSAPEKSIYLMDGCGHNTQYALPEEFANIVKEILR